MHARHVGRAGHVFAMIAHAGREDLVATLAGGAELDRPHLVRVRAGAEAETTPASDEGRIVVGARRRPQRFLRLQRTAEERNGQYEKPPSPAHRTVIKRAKPGPVNGSRASPAA